MPVARMKMRPWLEKMIESNKVPGLRWVDKDQKMFSITWKHAARHGWQVETDASLFKYWAIHTGKYKEGVDDSDPKKWKANFRCAMNSLPDVEQVKCQSVNKGQQAIRVYKMVEVMTTKDKRTKTKEGKRRNKCTKTRSEMDFSQDAPPFDDTCSTQENTVDSTEQQEMVSVSEVPDCETTIEIGPDSTVRFEVSPNYSPVYEDTDDIIEIFQQLDTNWMQSISDNRGLLNNELYSETNSSPHSSQWSDTSSGDEIDIPLYTILGTGNVPNSDDIWATPYYAQYQTNLLL